MHREPSHRTERVGGTHGIHTRSASRVWMALAAAFLLLLAGPAAAIEWQVPLEICNGAAVRDTIRFGVHPAATNGIDPALGEVELPPWPPSSLFEARFQIPGTEGTKLDLRDTTHVERSHTIKWQAGQGGYPVKVRWNRAALPYATLYISDGYGGVFIPRVNMYDTDSLVVPASLSFVKLLTLSVTPGVSPGAFPVLDPIPGATIYRNQQFPKYRLDDYVFDPDNPDQQLQWFVTENQALVCTVDQSRILRVHAPTDWIGSETVTLTVRDPAGHTDHAQVTFAARPGGLPAWFVPIEVRNGAQELRVASFGIDPAGTDGIDPGLGEIELPSWPPQTAFDLRFLLPDGFTGSVRDIRASTPLAVTYQLRWQPGNGGYPIVITWPASLPLGQFSVSDAMGGAFIPPTDMSDTTRIGIPATWSFITGVDITVTAVVDLTPPTVPLNLSATDWTSGSVTLHWTPCQEEHFAYYEILYGPEEFRSEPAFFWDWREDAALRDIATATTTVLFQEPGHYYLGIRAWDTFGNAGAVSSVVADPVLGVSDDISAGSTGNLGLAVWPNPAREGVRVWHRLLGSESTTLELFDAAGRLVTRRLFAPTTGGAQGLSWDGRDRTGAAVPAGVYFVRIEAGKQTSTKRLVVAR